MKYPEDFTPFDGKHLSDKEINQLLQEAIKDKHTFLATGDTAIEIDSDGNITIWQQRADKMIWRGFYA